MTARKRRTDNKAGRNRERTTVRKRRTDNKAGRNRERGKKGCETSELLIQLR